MYKSFYVLVLAWEVHSDLVDRTGNTADLCLRGCQLPIVLTVSYAFPKAFQVSSEVAGPHYVTSRLFSFGPFPFSQCLREARSEVICFCMLCQILQQKQQ